MLHKLRHLLSSLTEEMDWGIREYGTDYRSYPMDVKQTVAAGMATFQAIIPIVRTAIITKDGAVDERALRIIDGAKAKLPELRSWQPE